MGSGDGDEAPIRHVTISPFEFAKTLVTNKQYQACVEANACTPRDSYGTNFDGEDQPVVGVTWEQAKAFSMWVGGRLPSEAEWEYAARSAGKNRKFPWGDAPATCERAVIKGCASATQPVCLKPSGSTEQGLCDMAGNAWEWVQDWYHDSYASAPSNERAWERPPGAERVERGGSWFGVAEVARSAFRSRGSPTGGSSLVGFRPAR